MSFKKPKRNPIAKTFSVPMVNFRNLEILKDIRFGSNRRILVLSINSFSAIYKRDAVFEF